MRVLDTRRTKILYKGGDFNFRSNTVTLSPCIYLFKNMLLNAWRNFRVITEQLSTGTHKFSVRSVDNLGNESDLIEENVTIGTFQNIPRFITWEYLENYRIKISWEEPSSGAPDAYRIYSNDGSGEVDKTHIYDTVDGSLKEAEFDLTAGDWVFVVEALNDNVESSNMFAAEMTIPRENATPPNVLNENNLNIAVALQNVSVGKLRVSFPWVYGTWADKFRIYHDNGTGTVDYGNYIEFDRQDGIVQNFLTEQMYFGKEDRDYLVVVRAVSQYGVESGDTNTTEITLDGVKPENVSNLDIGTTF